jgi:1,4-dihydroxy-2-naphthoate octaprenyltransferase
MKKSELVTFFVHLRWHYQLLILSGGFLLGGLYHPQLALRPFLIQFLNVHLLLNGGVTAYNSYWDDDDGPIGGLENPPKMTKWMHPASIAVQLIGLVLAVPEGVWFVALYLLTMALSVCYSSRSIRWKGHPLKSLICVGIGTGTNTFLMGYLAAGDQDPGVLLLVAASGVALMVLSIYPVSQVFQIDQDGARGDRTFAVAFGLEGVRRFFAVAYPIGVAVVSASLFLTDRLLGIAFAVVGAIGGLINARTLFRLEGKPEEYRPVMRLKYRASLSFVLFLVACLVLRQLFGPVTNL